MKTLVKLTCIALFLSVAGSIVAQNVLDGVYVDDNTPSRRVIPYTFLREADVMWSKTVWREIDLREKMNLPLYYPMTRNQNREALWDVIKSGVKNGELQAYDFDLFDWDNSFSVPLTRSGVDSLIEPVMSFKLGNGQDTTARDDIDPSKIRAYMLKEVWFFDKQRSVMDVRILGIAPMSENRDPNTGSWDDSKLDPLFWIYFPQARPLFAVKEVFNTHNDAERRTYEDVFWKRLFSSYIVQNSNVYNRTIESYAGGGIKRLLEGEAIKHKMFGFEHDMWQY